MTENDSRSLTPKQAADVILYYHAAENEKPRQKGWLDKVALGRSAFHTTLAKHNILPDKMPMLTSEELENGMSYLEECEQNTSAQEVVSWPTEPTDEQWKLIDQVVSGGLFSYDEAYFLVMGVEPNCWKQKSHHKASF